MGICLEFWVGVEVALGVLKVRLLYKAKSELEKLKGKKNTAKKFGKQKPKKKKKKK